jgi:hypothetical protein
MENDYGCGFWWGEVDVFDNGVTDAYIREMRF